MRVTALVLLLAALPAAAQVDHLVAQRTAQAVQLDGRLDEPAWASAPVFSGFVESFPNAGQPASFKTEARVLYDDEFLYVGIKAFDPDPKGIARQLGRRDSSPSADRIEIAIDSNNDRRSAADFVVNAAGVLRDSLLFGDVNFTDSWDAVWDASVSINDDGWSAEVAIPFRVLRFSAATEQQWGMVIRRYVPRTHQVFDSTLIPREANPINVGNLVVSRFGRLTGLSGVKPTRGIEILPYAAGRATLRPQFSNPARPVPRLLDPSFDLGLDFRASLTSHITLTGAVNPDFGQVEADQVIQNLSTSEPFFQEKRPFFLEGLDIFQPVGAEYGSPQQLFYSRRIGLNAPILGAAKVSGSAREGLDVGVLETVVMGAGNSALVPVGYGSPDPSTLEPFEANPNRSWKFHLNQPLHFGPEDALPIAHPVTTNYFAGVARQRFGAGSAVGATFTSATPLADQCRRNEFATVEEYVAAGCAARGSNALGLDVNLRDEPGIYGGYAQLAATQQVGGDPEGRVLRDGTVMKPGDLGFGGHMRAGKLGGEPFRWDVQYVYEDPKLDMNDIGFQPLSNYQWADLNLHFVRPSGFGKFHNFSLDYNLDLNWTADGKALPRGINTNVFSQLQLPTYDTVMMRVGLELPQYDTREIPQAGVPFERASDVFVAFEVHTDANRKLFANADVFVATNVPRRNLGNIYAWGWDFNGTFRPQDRLETNLQASYGHKPAGPRWVDFADDNVAVFGMQDPEFLSVTLRQQYVIAPRLTAQLYAQLFSDVVRYGSFTAASLEGREHLELDKLEPYSYGGDPSEHFSVLNLNAVLRWEYRLGSTIYLVYTRSQSELPPPGAEKPARTVLPARLGQGPVTESVLLKWSWWWDV
ncbi:MAG: DUF5916 domain-containing protein [Myxococcaceae bacterium]